MNHNNISYTRCFILLIFSELIKMNFSLRFDYGLVISLRPSYYSMSGFNDKCFNSDRKI